MEEGSKKIVFLAKHPILKDILSLISFIACVVIGTLLLTTFIFRSYSVVGRSMENTLLGNDRLIVNRLAVSIAHFNGKEYIPERGQIIVFANGAADGPLTCDVPTGIKDQYIIKRVVAFPGERVIVKDGVMTVFNEEYPEGHVYDEEFRSNEKNGEGPKVNVSGEVDLIVPEGELFVSGDNREGSYSYDSRNGLGTIPFCRIIGPAILRIWPLDRIRIF